jgi:hypothetical protein
MRLAVMGAVQGCTSLGRQRKELPMRRVLVPQVAAILAVLGSGPAAAASLVATSTSSIPFQSGSMSYVHYANNHYWVAFHNGTRPMLYNSRDGVSWTSRGRIFSTFDPVNTDRTWAVRFSGSNVIAFAVNPAGDDRYYRNAVLNADGTVTWNAAEAPLGIPLGAWFSHNALILDQQPLMYRTQLGEGGSVHRGSQLNGPTWQNSGALPGVPAPTGNFAAGALFATGGGDPDDFIILRATTSQFYAAGRHRLVTLKWDESAGSFDAGWYNVSTLGGLLLESATTEVTLANAVDQEGQQTFSVARDNAGNIHAVYVNQNGDAVHYKKAAGFNDSWSRLSTDVTQSGSAVDKVALSAVANNNLYLFYSKGDGLIYYRRFDGTSWGAESTLKSTATALQGALAPMESANGCQVGLAWTEGAASPYSVMFSLGVGDCSTQFANARVGPDVNVTTTAGFVMNFDEDLTGGPETFYDLSEDPTRANDLAAGGTLFLDELSVGGFSYVTGTVSNGYYLLESTPTRTRVRQMSYYQRSGSTEILGGVRGIGDYTAYTSGRMAVRWNLKTTVPITYDAQQLALNVRYQNLPSVFGNWAPYSDTGLMAPNGPGDSDFVLAQSEVAGVRTDFLQILYADWAAADQAQWTTNDAQQWGRAGWLDSTAASSYPIGTNAVWNLLTYFKPTNFLDNTDPAVITKRDEYRNPDDLASPTAPAAGGGWFDTSENTSSPSDFFNESEAAYTLDFDPATGLTFDLDGGGAGPKREKPFFKVRQWRSLQDPSSVTLEGAPLTNDVDFKADVKPFTRVLFYRELLWYSTLENDGEVTSPNVGTGGQKNGGATYVAGLHGGGVGIWNDGDSISFPITAGSGNFNKARGSIAFRMKPDYDSHDGQQHDIAGFDDGANNSFKLRKLADNTLHFTVVVPPGGAGNTSDLAIAAANYSWRANEWVYVFMSWNDTATADTDTLDLEINGDSNPNTGPTVRYTSANLTVGPSLYLGDINDGNPAFSRGTYDEVHVYRLATTMAYGGLGGVGYTEYAADPATNLLLNLTPVNATTRQGRYLYLGTDSKFRGINAIFQAPGTGGADLVWEYWDGSDWASLEAVSGFTDQTQSFKRNGTIYWTADPPGWAPYTRQGLVELYYVRAYLAPGTSYGTQPTEGIFKTDILLLQYCGDVAADGQTFSITPPVPTAVTLSSFQAAALDGAVELTWATASELQNLGFHLYRATSAGGPYERITSALVPGLGSSPAGARYSYRDAGLVNGETYHYQLEDVETTGATKRHGPVAATPQAGAAPPPDPTAPPVPAEEPPPPSARITYGDPGGVSLRVLERGAGGALLELVTRGFFAVPQEDGTVRLEVPGFEPLSAPGSPALPVRRVWLEAVAGRGVRIAGVRAFELQGFSGLRPADAGAAEIVVSAEGTVRPGTRKARAAWRRAGLFPAEPARIVEAGFQGEVKKALVELSPLRWDGAQLLLARRLLVRVSFQGAEPAERSTRGARGRRHAETKSHAGRAVLARLGAAQAGLYRLAYEEVFGVSGRALPTSSLRLARRGDPIAFHVEPDPASFGRGSALYFLSEGSDSNPDANEAVYELEQAPGGRMMAVATGAPWGADAGASRKRREWEQNRYYQSGLLEAPSLWLWDIVVSPAMKSYPFTLSSVSGTPARLQVWLQGASDFEDALDHHVRVSVNGSPAGDALWDGKTPKLVEAELAPGVLRTGENRIEIHNVGDTGAAYSMVFLDRFAVTSSEAPWSEAGVFEGSFAASGRATLPGLGAGSLVVETAPDGRWLRGASATAAGLAFRVEAGRSYRAVSSAAVLRPQVRRAAANGLRSTRNRADYLLVAPREFLSAAEPLIERRRTQGLVSRAVAIEDVYDEFGFGEAHAAALKEFLEYAYHHWQQPSPRYVLLLGDATYDGKDYLRTGVVNRVPALVVRSTYLWTASDPGYAAVNGPDLLPDLAIGRLPAANVEQARSLVAKTLAYEEAGAGLLGPAVMVADDPDKAGDFEADSDAIAAALADREVEKVYLRRLGPAATRGAIVAAFDRGASLLSYVGHGGIAVWASENVLNNTDVAGLAPQPHQPIVVTMNCLNGYFHFPPMNSLAEELLKADGRGAAAAFSPSGLSVNAPAHTYQRALVEELARGGHARLGDAVLAAQRAYADAGELPELLAIYHLFGDPALKLR